MLACNGGWRGGDGGPGDNLALVVEGAKGKRPGVQIDAIVESVLSAVESHRSLPVQGVEATPFKCASRTEAMMSFQALNQTGRAIGGMARHYAKPG